MEQFNCRSHADLVESIDRMEKTLNGVSHALLGSMENPGGALAKINDLVTWKEQRQNDIKALTFRLVSFVGGAFFMMIASVIVIAKWISR